VKGTIVIELGKLVRASLLAGCCLAAPIGAAAAPQKAPVAAAIPSDAEVEARARALIARMTPAEKAGQLNTYFYFAQFMPPGGPIDQAIAKGEVGGVLFVTDPVYNNRLQKIAREESRLKIPLMMGFDVIHGLRTIYPVPIAMAASWDPALVENAQANAAAEARAVGVHLTFAPNADIARDPRWGRIVETAGEDPYLGAAMAAAQVRGFQGPRIGTPGRLIAGPKHFAGYGASLGGRDYDEVNLSRSELWNVYLPPFKAAVDAGAGNIMSAYMGMNGVPGAANHWLLTDVLRDTWKFKGFVVSDADAVRALTVHGLTTGKQQAAERALKAGMNVEMVAPGQTAAMQSLPQSVAEGRVTAGEVDAAVLPVLEAKIRLGLFENPYVDPARAETVLNSAEHRALARVAAQRTAVLLKNENGLLPLDRKAVKSLAMMGPLADAARDTLGSWVFSQNKPSGPSILAGIRAKVGPAIAIGYSEGVRLPERLNPSPFGMIDGAPPKRQPLDETAEIARAVQLARGADVAVLVLGEGQEMSGEMASRASLDLPGRQQELLDAVVATGKPVVVLLMSARPLNLKDTKAGAVMDIWYPGSEGGAAVADLLFGDAVPGGKLPFTWLRSAAQAPLIYSHLTSQSPENAHKRYWDVSNAPEYVFGHGLSYTSFGYANLKVAQASSRPGEAVTVTADLTNTGKRAGDEVAQLYLHQRSGLAARPVRELKGFQRVTLKPGETRRLTFTVPAADLRYWNEATNGWVQDEAAFDVWVGGSSDAKLAGTFTIRK
jgi:beta-glucosidase